MLSCSSHEQPAKPLKIAMRQFVGVALLAVHFAFLGCIEGDSVTSKDDAAIDAGPRVARVDSGVPHNDSGMFEADAGNTQPDSGSSSSDAGHVVSDAGILTDGELFFAAVDVDVAATVHGTPSEGDLWPSCWASDDALYAASGDGFGFGENRTKYAVAVSRISGTPGENDLAGTFLAADGQISTMVAAGPFYLKPTGMVCVRGEIYLAVQSLSTSYDRAPQATIVRSIDRGHTWLPAPTVPMFDDYVFTTIMFADFGKDSTHAFDDFVYAYGLDNNWRFSSVVESPTQLFLARVPADSILNRSAWVFFAGASNDGTPLWTPDIQSRQPVLTDETVTYTLPFSIPNPTVGMTKINQGSVVYLPGLHRYLYSTWTEYTFEFYLADKPWGLWRKLHSTDFGFYPWSIQKNGGYATTIPSKFLSPDGKHMYLAASSWSGGVDHNHLAFRSLRIEPFEVVAPSNSKGPDSLVRHNTAVTPLFRTTHWGLVRSQNDGIEFNQSEDSYSGEHRAIDWWGYAFSRPHFFNRLRYVTGRIDSDAGGWFDNISVQVSQSGRWVDVPGQQVNPTYPANAEVPEFQAYDFTFDDTWGDGIRIVGKPGGPQTYTSIAELDVFFE